MQAEHRELDACFDAVRTALHDEDGARAAAAVEGLQRLLEAHFESEELLYYPPLRALRPDREPALEGFTRDHEELCAQLLQALDALRKASLAEALEAFEELAVSFAQHELLEGHLLEVLEREIAAHPPVPGGRTAS